MGLNRDGEPEYRTDADFGLYADSATHELDKLAGNRQSQAGTTKSSRRRIVCLLKRDEQLVDVAEKGCQW